MTVLRRVLIFVLAMAATLYLAVFALLAIYQRDFLFIPDKGPPSPPPADYQARRVAVPNGDSVLVWSIPPADAREPVFVFFTGNEARITDFAPMGERFHARGWGVVLASYRGYSGNPGSPSEAGILEDARAVLASLPKYTKLILWGHSLGSGVAARMASEGRGNGLVLEAAYTSVVNVAARKYWIYPVRLVARDPFETEKVLPKIKIPVLLFHGANDPVVPFDMGQTLAVRFGDQAMFVPVAGGGHVPHQRDLMPYVIEWLRKTHLRGPHD
ncbi:MAG TPA: alpha/beta hydrolase [Rhizomicrobium sp.]|jgi:hypothetical protein